MLSLLVEFPRPQRLRTSSWERPLFFFFSFSCAAFFSRFALCLLMKGNAGACLHTVAFFFRVTLLFFSHLFDWMRLFSPPEYSFSRRPWLFFPLEVSIFGLPSPRPLGLQRHLSILFPSRDTFSPEWKNFHLVKVSFADTLKYRSRLDSGVLAFRFFCSFLLQRYVKFFSVHVGSPSFKSYDPLSFSCVFFFFVRLLRFQNVSPSSNLSALFFPHSDQPFFLFQLQCKRLSSSTFFYFFLGVDIFLYVAFPLRCIPGYLLRLAD